jgi:hypothetical protein
MHAVRRTNERTDDAQSVAFYSPRGFVTNGESDNGPGMSTFRVGCVVATGGSFRFDALWRRMRYEERVDRICIVRRVH